MQQLLRSSWPRWLLAGVAAAIILLSFLVPLVRGFIARSRGASQADEHGPGAPSIRVRIERGGRGAPGAADDLVFPGDRIRFNYSSERATQFALLRVSQDRASVVYPQAATTVPMPAAQDAALDLEVELDNLAGDVRVFGLFCEKPHDLEPLRTSLQKEGDLPKLTSCRVDRVTLRKKLQ